MNQQSREVFPSQSWLTLNWVYTYRYPYEDAIMSYNKSPAKPVLYGEGGYEYCPWSGDYSDNRTRKQAYLCSPISGAAGHGYGCWGVWDHGVFSSWTWQSVIDSPGAYQMGYWKNFFQSFNWWTLVPDYSGNVMTSSKNSGFNATACAKTADNRIVVVYVPYSRTITINMSSLAGTAVAKWYDPTTSGSYRSIGTFGNSGTRNFTTPGNNSRGHADWVLLLDARSTTAAADISEAEISVPVTEALPLMGAERSVYNAADSTVVFNFGNDLEKAAVEIYSVAGTLIQKIESDGTQAVWNIDRDIASGIYVYTITVKRGESAVTKKGTIIITR
ncbi:DUF4038 domain-containing protein [Spirochaetota bacterium]